MLFLTAAGAEWDSESMSIKTKAAIDKARAVIGDPTGVSGAAGQWNFQDATQSTFRIGLKPQVRQTNQYIRTAS